jgi:metal-responsive CopG/Arc/MetJ family transcriptional regulator
MRKKMNNEVPFQIEQLINSLLNKSDNVYIRQNYRARLETIKEAIDKSIKKYDNELYVANTQGKKKRA